MPVLISLLRGVNVGGHRKLKMDELRAVYESLGCGNVKTYVQSGNVIFTIRDRDVATIRQRIEKAIERKFGFHADVIVRTASEMRDVIARNPFATREDIESNKLLVSFLAAEPSEAIRQRVEAIAAPHPEEVRIGGRELYIYFTNGMARPKLPAAQVDRTLGMASTGRNWNTVMKLLEIAEALAAESSR